MTHSSQISQVPWKTLLNESISQSYSDVYDSDITYPEVSSRKSYSRHFQPSELEFESEIESESEIVARVYILSSNPNSERCQRLKSLFGPSFLTEVSIFSSPISKGSSHDLKRDEQYRIVEAMIQSEESDPQLPTLILKDTSITHLSRKTLEKKIRTGLQLLSSESDPRGCWDIFY
jgi:hypothetical protein